MANFARYLINYLSLAVTRVRLPPSQALRLQLQASVLEARETGDEHARDQEKEKERRKTLSARRLASFSLSPFAPTTFAARRLGTRQRVRNFRSVRKSQYDRNFLHNSLSHLSIFLPPLKWRSQYTFRSAILFKFRFFGLINDSNEISNVKKKSLKKIKYWQRNGGFKFWPEVKITRLIDTFSAAVFSNQFFYLRRTL